ncbi:MAG: outer membrane protein assembly factor BamD [Phycisphaeraceae bacterium]
MKPHLMFIVAAIAACAGATFAQETFELGKEGFTRTSAPDAATPGGELAGIAKALADGRADDAEDMADAWIESHHNHRLLPQAYLLRADAKIAQNNEFKALYDYEYLIRTFPGSPQFQTALHREYEIAQMYAGGRRRKIWGMRIVPTGGEAEELLIRIQERDPGSKLAEQAGKSLGDFYYRRGEMYMASDAYSIFVDNYPRSQWSAYAMQRQVDANLATFKGPAFDGTGLYEARARLYTFKERFPGPAEQHGSDELLVRIDESLAEKDLLVARWYHTRGNVVSAAYMLGRVVTDHPSSAAAQAALADLRQINPEQAAAFTDEKVAELLRQHARQRPTEQQAVNQPAVESKEPVETNAPIVAPPNLTAPE